MSDAILHAIGKASDDSVSAHYAAKTLENIFSAALGARPNSVPEALGTPECLSSLLKLSASSAATEPLRTTAAAAASHLLRIQPSLGVSLLTEPKLSTLLAAVRDGPHRLVQPLTTAIAAALLAPQTREAVMSSTNSNQPPSIPTSPALIRALARTALSVLTRPQGHLRVKGGILLASIISMGGRWLQHSYEVQMLPALEKLSLEHKKPSTPP